MNRILLVDDEWPALEEMEYYLNKYDSVEIVGKVQDARTVLSTISEIKPDAIFLDINMSGMNGLELAQKIHELNLGVVIIFVTAYSQYALDAFKSYPLDYIMKPIAEKRLVKTMEQLNQRIHFTKYASQETKRTAVRCFGSFEAYHEHDKKTPIKFVTRQTREMFAYLITRFEKHVTREELIDSIFSGVEDKKTINLLHVTAYNLRRALEEAEVSRNDITITGNYTLQAAEGVCDYIDFSKFIEKTLFIDTENIQLAEKQSNLYRGAYLQNEDYFWAEEIRTELELAHENLLLKMADYYFHARELQKSERILLTLLRNNPLCEKASTSLLELFMQSNDYKKFIEYYVSYQKMLYEEFRLKPDKKFHLFYQDSMKNY